MKTCPKDHPVGTQGRKGFCTALKCGQPAKTKKVEVEEEEVAIERREEEKLEGALAVQEEEAEFLARLRRAGLDPRKPLSGKEAEDWADEQMVKLLPIALANLAEDLKYGSPGQRTAAARQVLDSTGRARKEAAIGGGSPIVILTGAGDLEAPWRKAARLMADAAKEAAKATQVVEGEVVNAKK